MAGLREESKRVADFLDDLPAIISEERRRRKLTQPQAAEDLGAGITTNSVNGWENYARNPTLPQIIRICRWLSENAHE